MSSPVPTIVGVGLRFCVVKSLAKRCGNNFYSGVNVEIRGFENLEIGNNVSIHRECYVDAKGGLSIGDDVSIAHQCSILTENHSWGDNSKPIKYNDLVPARVTIENDVWLGCGVRVLPGVTIRTRSIAAAGAIVCKDVMSRTIVGGNPAKVLKEI